MLSKEDCETIATAAAAEDLPAAAVRAVVEVESGGRLFARVGGRDEPLIRFEGHYFDRLCKPSVRAKARRAGLASPHAGAVANPSAQPARWALLRRAASLDHDAAYEATSWGLGQVMGAHWRRLGYGGIDALVAAARSGLSGQIELLLRFVRITGLAASLRSCDWNAFARGYNGPAYRRNRYGERLRSAYAACVGGAGANDAASVYLRAGDCGERVVSLQRQLAANGARLPVDGRFGPRTEAALVAFQRRNGLDADGICGPVTMQALAKVSCTRMDSASGKR